MRRKMQMVVVGGVEREMEVVVDEGPRLRADGAKLARVLRHVADRVEKFGTCWDSVALAQAAIDRADRSERECHADGGKWFGWMEPQDLRILSLLSIRTLDELEQRWAAEEQDGEGGEE